MTFISDTGSALPWMIAVFVAALWTLSALGLVQAVEFLMLYTTICLVVSVLGWIWMAWREKRARHELAACARLLEALRVDSGGHERVA